MGAINWIGNVNNGGRKLKEMTIENKELLEARKKRCLDVIFMEKEPDRVPVLGSGMNFFPAKYGGITCEEYMFDLKKNLETTLKVYEDFDYDMAFGITHLVFGLGKIGKLTDVDLLLLPGRDLDPNSGYQFNELERITTDQYPEFAQDYSKFFRKHISKSWIKLFDQNIFKIISRLPSLGIAGIQFLRWLLILQKEYEARGIYGFYGTAGFPPYDIFSFGFRGLHSLSRDLMKKETREYILQIMEMQRPRIMRMNLNMAKLYPQNKGVWFVGERAFSLSPRQFERFYWRDLKPMIIEFVEKGFYPILTLEQDVNHNLHFLKELPTRISRKCVFNCDMGDILEADKILDGHMAIWGGIPLSTMCVGSPKDVEKQLEKITPQLMNGGGWGCQPSLGTPDEAKPENIHAMINYMHKHGVYRA